ncbi:MAG: V-type ATP synthase subunit K [Spirochaetales bacterium]|nr:V-type ATP synthase subunit K [Spirochaetales bacterium]
MVNIEFIGMAAALALSAVGSGFGAGIASLAAVGGWKKCYVENKPAPFIMIAFTGAPLTQTIYGFLLMNFIASAIAAGVSSTLTLSVGVLGGIAIGVSAYMQGRAAAAACDALAETGKGTANYFIVIGIIETVALFTLVLSLLALQ